MLNRTILHLFDWALVNFDALKWRRELLEVLWCAEVEVTEPQFMLYASESAHRRFIAFPTSNFAHLYISRLEANRTLRITVIVWPGMTGECRKVEFYIGYDEIAAGRPKYVTTQFYPA